MQKHTTAGSINHRLPLHGSSVNIANAQMIRRPHSSRSPLYYITTIVHHQWYQAPLVRFRPRLAFQAWVDLYCQVTRMKGIKEP